ncbi:MAG: hypothetical protein QOC55_1769 [Thermoleophilaceae bacterium]|jgi:hypothetical protein|nr:hypothetical protein [Thermoleophilaceae bacterium]
MAVDRASVRRRVRTITAFSAGGAAVLTAAFALGARGNHAAAAPASSPGGTSGAGTPRQDTVPQADQAPYQQQAPDQGFAPPTASTAPPAGMSGGS